MLIKMNQYVLFISSNSNSNSESEFNLCILSILANSYSNYNCDNYLLIHLGYGFEFLSGVMNSRPVILSHQAVVVFADVADIAHLQNCCK
ncbi:hypothetical protein MUK42_26803 [Musa troglodytarum]|uniref:Uncharacterized protein n=1 Tax=Musa troglodytarum TaxID=320322 RepID=A0A9E7F8A9_9LILI|nr:hypothetical protein MUK42_26803 [Musa troglodytarum]